MKIALICVDAGGGRPFESGNFRGVCPILNRAKVELIKAMRQLAMPCAHDGIFVPSAPE